MVLVVLARRHLIAAGVLAAIALALIVGDWLIVSEEEQVHAVVDRLRDAVEREDPHALMEEVSGDFQSESGMTREALPVLAKQFFDFYGAVEFIRFRSAVNRSGDIAVAQISAYVSSGGGRGAEGGHSIWDIELQKESDGAWRVTDIAPVQINGRDVATWRDVGGMGPM